MRPSAAAILSGIKEGEQIVVSGTFLVDSESRMRAAALGIYGESAKDPVCGMDIDESKAKAGGRTAQFESRIYYFCSDDCKAKFEKNPRNYANK